MINKNQKLWSSTLFTISYLDADTASYAQLLGDNGDLVIGRHLDTELAHAHHRTRAFALLATSLRLAAVTVDDCNTSELAALLLSAPLRHGCPASTCHVRRECYMWATSGWQGRILPAVCLQAAWAKVRQGCVQMSGYAKSEILQGNN